MAYQNGTKVYWNGDLKPHSDSANENSAEPLQLSEAYVHSLASLGLERLQNEPGRLHTEAIAVDEALHSLSLDHYGVFIQNQECVRHVKTQGGEMGDHLSALLAEVQGLGAEFSVFQKEAAELVGGHKRNRQTLKHHMQLVELLEIPQLMDACVRSDLMEEALSIATFATTLERRHRNRRALSLSSTPPAVGAATSPGVFSSPAAAQSVSNGSGMPTASSGQDRDVQQLPGVIKMIVDEVRDSARNLHERLLAKLRGSIQLTTCLQVVSCLRRLELLALEDKNLKRHQETLRRYAEAGGQQPNGVAGKGVQNRRSSASETGAVRSGDRSPHQLELVEMKLQVDFLEARDAWLAESSSRNSSAGDLQHVLGLGSNSGPYQSLMDLIETSRSQWFEVATQFRAIFLSDSSATTAASSAASNGFGGGGGGRVAGGAGGDVLSLWLLRRVAGFVGQLKAVLPLVEDAASLRGLLEECMFFGASMGRLGADFRGLLVPVFEERVCSTATNQWASATTDFVATLRDVVAIEAAGGNGSSLLHVPEKSTVSTTAWPSDELAGQDAPGREGAGLEEFGDGGPPAPPRSLMAFPPVARLVNLTLTSFNNLRECLPVSVEGLLTEELVRCFTTIFQNLADLRKTTLRLNIEATTVPGSRIRRAMSTARALELSCEVLALQAVPHITLCFAFLFGEGATAPGKTSGVSTDSTAASPAREEGRAEKLSSRLLGVMEKFGIYEKPSSPPPPGKPFQGGASFSQGAAAELKKTTLPTTPSPGSDRAGTSPRPATVVGSSSGDILKTESGTSAEPLPLDDGRREYASGVGEPRAVGTGVTDGPSGMTNEG